jgi:hypothetical protein
MVLFQLNIRLNQDLLVDIRHFQFVTKTWKIKLNFDLLAYF